MRALKEFCRYNRATELMELYTELRVGEWFVFLMKNNIKNFKVYVIFKWIFHQTKYLTKAGRCGKELSTGRYLNQSIMDRHSGVVCRILLSYWLTSYYLTLSSFPILPQKKTFKQWKHKIVALQLLLRKPRNFIFPV